ncbi:MAG: anthranilate phosphoribosyltransferase [Kineothrix sp.]
MIKEAIQKIVTGRDLTLQEAEGVMDEIMGGQASQIQMAAYLTALSLKGETIDEITASAAGMRRHCLRLLHDMEVLEIVGTGGDKSNSFNISTASALVVSAAGVPVAKHGNRAASSRCGAADVLEALGVNIMIPPEKSRELLERIGICFLFAQNYHIAMKYVAPVRRELGIPTVFNILGPLSNPAGANMQLLGVYQEELIEPMAQVLSNLGVKNALVVYGRDGLDEISISAPTSVCEVRDGSFKKYLLEPEQCGMARCRKEDLSGGTPEENAEIIREILRGRRGPKADAVVLNSAAALYVADASLTLEKAVEKARETIDSGRAMEQLEKFVELSNEGEAEHDFRPDC